MKRLANTVHRAATNHPLASVLLVALLLRLPAVIFSRGFMASDDYYQTVNIAYFWLVEYMFNPDGFLTWAGNDNAEQISRFPLYNLFLMGQMALAKQLGMTTLEQAMYLVRAVHALISLLAVWAAYQITLFSTGRIRWAVIAGLLLGAHYLMPFLAVRTLIEMVGGSLFVAGIASLYVYKHQPQARWLILAGLLCGLSWTVRFQLAFAIAPIPFILLYYAPRWKAATVFTASLVAVLLTSGFVDLWLLGSFAASTTNYIAQSLHENAFWDSSPFMYIALLMIVPLPIASLLVTPMMFMPRFIKRHALLVIPIALFVLVHTLAANRQERFLLPVFAATLIASVLVIHDQLQPDRFFDRHRRIFRTTVGAAATVSLVLLPFFILHFPHKGVVEPLARINGHTGDATVVLMSLGQEKIYPLYYGGDQLFHRRYVRNWDDFHQLTGSSEASRIGYVLLYPRSDNQLDAARDSVHTHFPDARQAFHITGSPVTQLLHLMNPKHNPSDEVIGFTVNGHAAHADYSASQSQVISSP